MRALLRRVDVSHVLLAFFGIALVFFLFRAPLTSAYQRAALSLSPSAQRAASYGLTHLDRALPGFYNLPLAKDFYDEAARLDPTYPYVYHQLARIEFLQGNFNTALFFINKEIDLHGEEEPNAYYVKGLILGYMGRYDEAAKSYEVFLKYFSTNWAGVNDYAWVLLKAKRWHDAQIAIEKVLPYFPNNPWLLNSYATALYEQKKYSEAQAAAQDALTHFSAVSPEAWSQAYPGNDPGIASEGVATFREALENNINTIEAALASSTVQ